MAMRNLPSSLSRHGFFRGSSKHTFTVSDLDKLAREEEDFESITYGGKIRTVVTYVW